MSPLIVKKINLRALGDCVQVPDVLPPEMPPWNPVHKVRVNVELQKFELKIKA